MKRFKDRSHAGKELAERLSKYKDREDILVLGLPRGGIPVAYEIAKKLDAPLDVLVVRKLGLPYNEEVAFGAIASGGIKVLNEEIVNRARLSKKAMESVVEKEKKELKRRQDQYGSSLGKRDFRGKTIILVDDGIATGATMQAAINGLKQTAAAKVVMAIPTAPQDSLSEIRPMVDDAICIMTPSPFYGVGNWYNRFSQTTDDEVKNLLEKSK